MPELPKTEPARIELARTEAAYLLPQTIFVGDQGRLVVPLGQGLAGVEPFVLELPDQGPKAGPGLAMLQPRLPLSTQPVPAGVLEKLSGDPDLLVRRVELERRGSASRLLIDFVPYITGVIAFPPMEFVASGGNPGTIYTLTGLQAQAASILDSSQRILSDPASPLPVPGTNLLVYGTLVLVLALVFFGVGGSIWSRRHFSELWEYFRRRRLIRIMMRFLRRLRQESCLEKNGNPGFYLSLLSGELREFLGCFTGVNCLALTAGEFIDLPLAYPGGNPASGAAGGAPEIPACDWPLFICDLFRNWDNLRFSGLGVKMTDLFRAIKDAEKLVTALDLAEKERRLSSRESGPARPDSALPAAGLEGS